MKPIRIFIAEDEAMVALDLVFALEDAGATVIGPFMSLEECLEALNDAPPIDVALLDVDLAGREVFPAARVLAERGVPIVFHTAHAERSQLKNDFAGSVLCRKPCRIDKVMIELEALAA